MTRTARQVLVLVAAIAVAALLLANALPERSYYTTNRFEIDQTKEYAPGLELTFRAVRVGSGIAKATGVDRSSGVFLAIPYEASRGGGPKPAPTARVVTADGIVYPPSSFGFSLPPAESTCDGTMIFRLPFEALEGARLELRESAFAEFYNRGAQVHLGIDATTLAELAEQRWGGLTQRFCGDTAVPR